MRSRYLLGCFSLAVFSCFSFAGVLNKTISYYPEEFYQKVDNGLKNGDLKNDLFSILSEVHLRTGGHDTLHERCPSGEDSKCYSDTNVGYTRAREVMFGQIHLISTRDGYGVLDVYCQRMTTSDDFSRQPPGPDEIPDAKILNTEHTWPQSHFSSRFNQGKQKADLHILYPVLAEANSSRSNLKYGDVVTPVSQPCNVAKRGYLADGGSELYFEPPAEHKGNAARAVFYFSVRYKLPITPKEEASLKAWNRLDPVDEFELKRNDLIFGVQHSRNPFIDHPELIDLISDF